MRHVVALLGSALLFATPASAEWWEAKTDHFIVYSESSAKDAKDFADKMERLDSALRSLQSIKFSPIVSDSHRLTVFRSGDTRDISQLASGGRGGSGVAGFYIPRLGGSVSFTPSKNDKMDTGAFVTQRRDARTELDPTRVLFHEYAHHFMFQHFSAAYPSWYVEGFAETAATIELRPDGSFHLGNPPQYRADALFNNMMNVPVKRLLASSSRPTFEDQYGWYTIGWLLNHYLPFEPSRAGQLTKYLRLINAGTKPADAATQAFGDLDKLDKDIHAYKRRRPLPGVDVKPANFTPPEVAMRKLAPDEEAIIKVRMRQSVGVDRKLASKYVGDARAVAARFPQSFAVHLALAEAEADHAYFEPENFPRAEAAADRALQLNPNSVEAMIVKGKIELERGRTDKRLLPQARNWFAKAYKADPEHPAPLFYNYLTYYYEGGPIPESALIGLEKAYDWALFDPEIRLVLARQLLAEKKGPLARSILLPLAISPHESKLAKKMNGIVELIDASKLEEARTTLIAEMNEQEAKHKKGD